MKSLSRLFLMIALSVGSHLVWAHSGHDHEEKQVTDNSDSTATNKTNESTSGGTNDAAAAVTSAINTSIDSSAQTGAATYVSPLLEQLCLAEAQCLAMTLGTQATWTITKIGTGSKLVPNLKQLQYMDPQAWITVTEDSMASLNPQESRLIVSVPYSAPSFARILIPVQEVDVLSGEVLNVHVLELRVTATLTIEFYGDRSGGMYFLAPDTIQLQPHGMPVKVRFVNSRDNGTEHRIHAEGAIKHAPTNSLLSKVGDFYEYDVGDTAPVEARYYCHNHDTSLDQKKIKFNVTNLEELRAAVQFPDALSQ